MTPEEMAALHAQSFPDRPWSAREIEDLLLSRTVQSFVSPPARGWLLARVVPPEAEILTLAVDPAARRKGIGSDLLTRWIGAMAQQNVSDLHLEVAADNQPAITLYEGFRFAHIGRRRAYYTRGNGARVDAVLMHRALTRGEPD